MSLSKRTTTVNEIIERIHRDYGFQDIRGSEISEWIWDVVGKIGVVDALTNKITTITIEEYKGLLPYNLFSINKGGIRLLISGEGSTTRIPLREAGDIFFDSADKADLQPVEYPTEIDPATGEFFYTVVTSVDDPEYYTYRIDGNYITTGFTSGIIEIAYEAFPVDIKTGLPLIPDDPKYIQAVVSYMAWKIALRLMLSDKLSERKYHELHKLSLFNIPAARGNALIPDPGKMEKLRNRWLSPHPYYQNFDTGFRYSGSRDF